MVASSSLPFHRSINVSFTKQMLRTGESRVPRDEGEGLFSRFSQKLKVPHEIGDPEFGEAGLLGSEKLSRAADGQVLFGDLEPVGRFLHDPEPAPGLFAPRVLGDEQALGGVLSPSHPAAELVQLREPEALGVLDDHDRGVGHVDPHFDHDGGDEDLNPPGLEIRHDRFFLLALHPAVDQPYFELRENIPLEVGGHLGGIFEVQTLGLFHQGINHVGLSSRPISSRRMR